MTQAAAWDVLPRIRSGVTVERLLLAGAFVAGVALRVYIWQSILGSEDSDEAVLGLMVRHASHGHLTTFLWGEAYGGTLEVLLTVPVFWLFGSGHLQLISIPIVLDIATAVLVWRVGRRTIGEPSARFAAAVYWIWPAWTVYQHMRQVGFYASDTFFCALILLLTLRAKERPTAATVGLLGFVSGLAFYQTFQILPIVVSAAAWLVWRQRRVLHHVWLAVLLGMVGAAPLIVWNLRHDWGSAHLNAGANFPYYWRLRIFFSPVLPEDLGMKYVDSTRWLVALPVGLALYVALFGLFAYGAVRTRRRDASLVYMTAAVFPFLYALSPKAVVSSEPRYALTLAPCLALMAGHAASTHRRAALVLGAAVALSAVGLTHAASTRASSVNTGPVPSSPRSVASVVAELDRLQVTHVFTNYWLAYRLDFDTGERIVAVENGFDRLVASHGDVVPLFDPEVHWQPYQTAVRAAPHGFVFFARFPPSPAVLRTLRAHGYTRHTIPGFVVYARPVKAGTAGGT